MGRKESCAGLSVSQPGQEQGDNKGCDVEDRTDSHTNPDDHRTPEEHNTSIMEHNRSTKETVPPPRLRAVIEAWNNLPEVVKIGIVAMVRAALSPRL